MTAVPEDGRANKAVTALLAKRWRLPRSAIAVIQGATDRRKVLLLRSDDPAALAPRLEAAETGGAESGGAETDEGARS